MTQLNAYLTFNGNCREAMTFYRECLGGVLEWQTIADSPMATAMPPEMKACILHATLSSGDIVLMGSDMAPQHLIKGNAVSLLLSFTSEAAIHKAYTLLSEGGDASHPLASTHWGALFGHLTDKYGNQWLLHYLTTT